jgi:hypothetical protein
MPTFRDIEQCVAKGLKEQQMAPSLTKPAEFTKEFFTSKIPYGFTARSQILFR